MSIVPRFAMSTDRVPVKEEKQRRSGWKEYFDQAKELIETDDGPPRWFSPLECSSQWDNSPLMLFLPGIDGVGLALISHHHKLGRPCEIS